MLLWILGSVFGGLLLLYNGLACHEVCQYPFPSRRRARLLLVIWLAPYYGAYWAIRQTGYRVDQSNLLNGEETGCICRPTNPFDQRDD